MTLTLLYANRRNLPKRVRVVMDWLVDVAASYLQTDKGLEPKQPMISPKVSMLQR